jgi:hypothetical protein
MEDKTQNYGGGRYRESHLNLFYAERKTPAHL